MGRSFNFRFTYRLAGSDRRYRLISPPNGDAPYFAALDTPLLKLGKDTFTIRDACESIIVLGGIGSGKTSTSMTALLTSYMQAGFGGVYLCAKPGAAELLRKVARQHGRLHDIRTFDGSENSERMNVLDVASAQFRGQTSSLVGFLRVIIEAGRKASDTGGQSDGDGRFFSEGAMKDAAHVFPLLQEVEGQLRMRSIYDFLTSVPATPADAASQQWMQTSYCGRTLGKLSALAIDAKRTNSPDAARLARLWDDCAEYFLGEVARLDNRPKSAITATFSNVVYHMLHGDLNRLFCTDTTITPMEARRGKWLLVDLPALTGGAGSVIAATILKYLCSMAWQSETPHPDMRPVAIFADECQTWLDATDADTLATGRENRIVTTFATQDVPTLYAKLGTSGRDTADSLLGKFGTRIFHAQTCTKTNELAATMIGKTERFHVTESRSKGNNSGAGGHRADEHGGFNAHTGANRSTSQSTSGYVDWAFPPQDFAHLKTGGPRNKNLCEAVIIRNGRQWKATGKNWLLAELKQS